MSSVAISNPGRNDSVAEGFPGSNEYLMIREIDYSIDYISRALKENTVKTFNKVKHRSEPMHHLIK